MGFCIVSNLFSLVSHMNRIFPQIFNSFVDKYKNYTNKAIRNVYMSLRNNNAHTKKTAIDSWNLNVAKYF